MPRKGNFSPEVRERAVRLVKETRQSHESEWAAITSVAEKIGCTPERLRKWTRQSQRDAGERPGVTTEDKARIKDLERGARAPSSQRDSEESISVLRPGGARPLTEVMVAFIDKHKDEYGVEPM